MPEETTYPTTRGERLKDVWNDIVIAESDDPRWSRATTTSRSDSATLGLLVPTDSHTVCPGTGASYDSLPVDAETNAHAAQPGPDRKRAAAETKNRLAFWKDAARGSLTGRGGRVGSGCDDDLVDTFAEIADERRALADLLSELTGEQRAAQSLCDGWSVHDVAAHLIMPLEVSTPKFMLTMLRCRGSFDRANVRLTREQAHRPFDEIIAVLRRKAETRFTPPGSGPEAPLTDLLVHGLDIRWPLRLTYHIATERLQKSLTFLTCTPARGLVPKNMLDGLRFEANDIDWVHGSGPTVTGTAEALLLAITGRATALGVLSGDGVPTLHDRLS